MASITRRYGIIWSDTPIDLPSASSGSAQQHEGKYEEPTSTIVLSSPAGQFVDIRLLLKTPVTGSSAHDAAPTGPGVPASGFGRVAAGEVEPNSAFGGMEWAIGGQSSYTSLPNGRKHGKWTHWVSSVSVPMTSKDGSGGQDDNADEGEMETDAASGRVVEIGRMRNPATCREQYYSEVWGDVELRLPPAVPGAAVAGEPNRWTAGGQADRQKVADLKVGQRSYLVVKCEDAERHVRGLIVWVGQYCQGVIRHGERVTAERWEYDFVPNGGRGEWVRTFRSGDGSLPCGWLVKESDGIKRGGTLCAPKLLGDRDRWVIVDEDFTATDA